MPYIKLSTTKKIEHSLEEKLKDKFGDLIEILPGKSEQWLMLKFEGECHMYLAGRNDDDTAMLDVSIYGGADAANYEKLTAALTDAVSSVLDISPYRIYVKYQECSVWGFGGANF